MGFSRQCTAQTFRKLTRIPYRKPYRTWSSARVPRSILSQGGVPGGATRLSPRMPVSTEVKFRDTAIAFVPVAGAWNLVSAGFLQAITQTAGNGGRVGRSIKIVGITYRMNVTGNVLNPPVPYSMDIGIDRQANSALPVVADIYAGATPQSFPDPVFERRYKFLKRLELRDSNSQATLMSGTIRCSQVVNFSGNSAAITDMEDANIFLTFASAGSQTIAGTIRVNYIDN